MEAVKFKIPENVGFEFVSCQYTANVSEHAKHPIEINITLKTKQPISNARHSI